MASFDLKLQIFAGAGYGGLGLADRWCWFDMGTEDNVTAVTHTAHDTACMVGGLGNDAVFLDKTVVVFGTGKTCHINTVTDLNSFYSTDGHDRMSKSGIQLVKNRITQTSRNIFDPAFDHTACTVLVIETLLEIGGCFFCRIGVWHTEGIVSDLFF